MKTISMYELLGLIKDGKAPKKIKYDGRIFEFDELEEQYCYHNENYTINEDLNCHIDGLKKTILNDKVEIIEEDKKIEYEFVNDFTIEMNTTIKNEKAVRYFINGIQASVNKLIRNQRKLIDEVNKLKEDK